VSTLSDLQSRRGRSKNYHLQIGENSDSKFAATSTPDIGLGVRIAGLGDVRRSEVVEEIEVANELIKYGRFGHETPPNRKKGIQQWLYLVVIVQRVKKKILTNFLIIQTD
jgi:hypothetical protein